MKKYTLFFLISALVVVIDQLTKYIVKDATIINNILFFRTVKNTGAGFGLLKDQTMLLIFFSIIVIGVILFYLDRFPESRWFYTAMALVMGGTIGNLLDRIIHGYVIDFIDFVVWPVFNIADSSITAGIIMILLFRK